MGRIDASRHEIVIKAWRHRLGVLLWDWRRYTHALRTDDRSWVFLSNRHERLSVAPDGSGARGEWEGSSELHAARVFPSLGRRLLRRALCDHPLSFSEPASGPSGHPAVTFVLGHRGLARLPHLLSTLRSIGGQRDVAVECVVVEQSVRAEVREALPGWVRYVYTPIPEPEMPFNKSWAFNAGVRVAQGEFVVLHDGDMLAPCDYARRILELARGGQEVIDLKRFVFYLSERHTGRVFAQQGVPTDEPPQAIVQNLPGGSVAVSRAAYLNLGGFDEEFVGWGGEDLEFRERAITLKSYMYTSLPFVHLWHPPQPGKTPQKQTPGMARYFRLRMVPPPERIQVLRVRNRDRLA